jgi:hypothetical protein
VKLRNLETVALASRKKKKLDALALIKTANQDDDVGSREVEEDFIV